MVLEFQHEVLHRLPLAEAVMDLWHWLVDCEFLSGVFEEHRGASYERRIAFPVMVHLIADALLQDGGSGRKSFQRHRENGELPASIQAAYQKLSRIPLAVTEAFLREATQRLLQVVPAPAGENLPASLRVFVPIIIDGKAIKRVPKRLKPLRGCKGGVLGGKALVALHLAQGLAVAMACHPDGETNDAKLVPALLEQLRPLWPDAVVLYIADRQFCDLNQTAEFVQGDHHFLVRYHTKTGFHADAERPAREGIDSQGRTYREQWGWLGREGHKKRRYVRFITLYRPGEEEISVVTDLLDADLYPASDLLDLYLARWGIERVFQKITDVFHLENLIGTTPEGTLFQLAFCLLLYNQIQVVRSYVATAQQRPVETISTELLFDDVHRQLVALDELVPTAEVIELCDIPRTAAGVRQRLTKLLRPVWSERWVKAPRRKRSPQPKSGKRDHTSVYRIMLKYRKRQIRDSDSG
jgi:Transposase DDE domain